MDLQTSLIALAKVEGRRDALLAAANSARSRVAELTRRGDDISKAIICVQTVANELQADLTAFFTKCVQSALDIVFPNAYQFRMGFTSRRNQAELDMWLDRSGERIPPLDAAGGGVVDVISFALRTGCLLLSKKRPLLLLDEPFKFIRGAARERLGSLLNLLAVESHVQIIMVADVAGAPIKGATRHKISIKDGISEVETCPPDTPV